MAQKPQVDLVDIYVGQQLQKLRKKRHMTLAQFAKLLGVTYQQLQKYESGMNRLGMKNALHLSECFNIPFAYFFESFPSNNEPILNQSPTSTISGEEVKRLLDTYFKIQSKHFRSLALQAVEEFALLKDSSN